MEKEIIYAFIDSQNLKLGIKNQGWDLDFKKFYIFLKDKFKTTKVYLFMGYIKNNDIFYNSLKKIGYEIIFKPIIIKDNKIKGNVDAELVLQSMIDLKEYDKSIIISGDGDFYCLIRYLLNIDKIRRIIIPNKYKYSALLRNFSGSITFLNNTKDKLKKR